MLEVSLVSTWWKCRITWHEKEKVDLKQRSKVQCLRLGDSNSRLFSIATKMRRSKNSTLKSSIVIGLKQLLDHSLKPKIWITLKTYLSPPSTVLPTFPVVFPKLVSFLMNTCLTQQPQEAEVGTQGYPLLILIRKIIWPRWLHI